MRIVKRRGISGFLSGIKNWALLLLLFTGIRCASTEDYDAMFAWQNAVASPQQRSTSKHVSRVKIKSRQQKFPKVANLNSLLQWALYHNQQIKVARAQWQQSQTKYPQVVSLPDPILTYTYYLESVETRVGPQRHRLSLVQPIPFPYKLYLKGEIADDEVRLARFAYDRTIRDQIAKVQKNFYELLYTHKAIRITQKNEKLLQHFLRVATAEHDKGKAPVPDLLRAQAQVAQMEYDLIRLEELRQIQIGELNALLNRDPNAQLLIADNTYFPPTRSLSPFIAFYKHAVQKQQEILAAKVEQQRADHKLSLAFSEYFPDLSVGFSWIETGERTDVAIPPSDDGQDAWMLQFGMNLPIWVPRRNAKIREARLDTQRADSLQKELENKLAATLKKAYYKTTNAYRLVKLYQKSLLPQAEQSMRIAENWYRDGKGSFLGVLEVQSTYLNFSLALIRSRADYAQSLIEMARLSGGSLPESFMVGKEKKQQ